MKPTMFPDRLDTNKSGGANKSGANKLSVFLEDEEQVKSEWLADVGIAPRDRWVMLWLSCEAGSYEPLGHVVARYTETEMGDRWCEKSVAGSLNTGLRDDLIVAWRELPEGYSHE